MGSAKTVIIVTSQMDIVQMVSDIISLTSDILDAVLTITCVENVLYLWPVCAMVVSCVPPCRACRNWEQSKSTYGALKRDQLIHNLSYSH